MACPCYRRPRLLTCFGIWNHHEKSRSNPLAGLELFFDFDGVFCHGLGSANVKLSEDYSTARRWSMACVAWPTCGLAITESERALPGMMDQLEVELAKLGLDREAFTIRMTGCPNGCARPYNPDIGLVGKAKNRYTMYLGGRLLGNRLAFIYKDLVQDTDVVTEIVNVMTLFKAQRQPDETFGDFCHRIGKEALLEQTAELAEAG